MKFIAGSVRYLKQQFSEHTKTSNYNILAIGIIGTIGHPTYWLWWTYIDPQPNENLLMRLIGTVACALLLVRKFWPVSIARFLPSYYFLTVAYTLPFFFTYYVLSSHYSMLWSMAEVAMLFFSILVLSSLVVWLLNLIIGVGFAILCAHFFIPNFSYTDAHLHTLLYIYFPVFTFSICSGLLFSHSNIKGIATQERNKNKTLQTLAGSIAHEMRNPLSQIKASLHDIERALPIPAATQQTTLLPIQQLKNLYQYVAAGESAIQRGSQVIAMILDEVAAKPVNTENFSYLHAVQTTQKAIAEYGYETASERDKIRIDVQRDFIFKGDETLTLFVLFNLIKNALYYFKLKSSATLTITVNQPTITVRDTGPGIPAERLRHLFESFQTSGKQGGTGLGLAYCKRVMQAFGGDITCHSVLGEFTEFTLRFPEVPQSTWIAYEQSIIAKARPIFKNKRILVVDDDESLRIMTQDILSDLGAQIDQAENGQVALEKLAQASYDLVVMDLNMPVLDGYAAAEKIRAGAVAGYEKIPIIAYTTESAYMAQIKTQKVGIHRFLSKPCGPLVLIQTLEQALIEASAAHQAKKNPPRTLSGKTILIADDGESNRDILKYHLHDWGATVLEAQHGAEIIAQLNANSHCDALLLDMRMPGMDGLEVTQAIRTTTSAYRTIPIIAITGQTDEADMIAAYQAGVDDCLSKPVDADVLYEKLCCQLDKLVTPTTRTTLNAVLLPTAQKINPILFDTPRLEACIARGLFKHGENSAYVRQTKEWLAILEASVQNKDFKKMQDALHFIKGSSANIGATALSQWVARIEKQTADGNWPSEKDWFEKTKDVHTQTLSALQSSLLASK